MTSFNAIILNSINITEIRYYDDVARLHPVAEACGFVFDTLPIHEHANKDEEGRVVCLAGKVNVVAFFPTQFYTSY